MNDQPNEKVPEPVLHHVLFGPLYCGRAINALLTDYANLRAQYEAEKARLSAEVAILQNNLEAMESCDKSLREYIDKIESDREAAEQRVREVEAVVADMRTESVELSRHPAWRHACIHFADRIRAAIAKDAPTPNCTLGGKDEQESGNA